jgi:hypothetical protein
MRKMDISITKAKLKHIGISYGEEKSMPGISATVSLETEHGKKITEFHASTDAWQESDKMAVPPAVYDILPSIERLIETAITEHCQSSCKQLTKGGE